MLNIFTIINLAANAVNMGANAYSLNGNRRRRKENKQLADRLEKLETAYKSDMGNIQKDLDGIANGMKDMNTKLETIGTCTNGMGYDLQKLQDDTKMLQGKLEALYHQQSPVSQPVQVQQPQVQVQQPQVQQPQVQHPVSNS